MVTLLFLIAYNTLFSYQTNCNSLQIDCDSLLRNKNDFITTWNIPPRPKNGFEILTKRVSTNDSTGNFAFTVWIDKDGSVQCIKKIYSSNIKLTNLAENYLLNIEFLPAELNKNPTPTKAVFTVRFIKI